MEHTKEYARDAAADWPCGCRLALKKTCDCDNAAELDYAQCPMHAAAPALLEALEELADEQALFVPQLPPIYAERLTQARAAIKAAKGD